MTHWFLWWHRHHRHHHHHRHKVWLVVNNFAFELKPNQENEMAQSLLDTQIDNLSIQVNDASGNIISPPPAFNTAPSWTLTDPAGTGATLSASADGTSAVLTPAGKLGTVTVGLTATIGGQSFTASLDVAITSGAPASISIVAAPAPKP
jgi:hypothetical protein